MRRFIETHIGETFDLIVIGGGITGAAVAYDAASRGFSVALVEKEDFGCATSAATSKLIHGGFRYLANLELGIVRESLRERRILENIAPNLVYPIPVLIPRYDRGVTGKRWLMKAGMILYDLLSYDKGWTWDRSKRIGFHHVLRPKEALALEPVIPQEGLIDVYLYHDCSSLFPERLTLAFIKSAVKYGAMVSNYCKVEGFLFSPGGNNEISGVKVKDLCNNRHIELRGRLTVNCGGPWADLILGLAEGNNSARRIRRSEGIHILTRKLVSNNMIVMILPAGRGLFMIPWRGCTLVGTTDKEFVGNPDEYKVTKEAILELLSTANEALQGRERIDYKDILQAYGGLRPLVEDQSREVYKSSRRYEIYDNAREGLDGLITIEGGKYTTSRRLAQNAMKMVEDKLHVRRSKCATDKQHLAGCEIADINKFISGLKAEYKDFEEKTVDHLGRYYGNDCPAVLELARQDRSLAETLNTDGEILAQATYAIRKEMAVTLKDILCRRTGIGALGDPGEATIARLAEKAAEELNWDTTRKEREISEAEKLFGLPE